MAFGTVTPILAFALISLFRVYLDPRRALWWEWGSITLCVVCLQAYIFNTASHPGNNFNLIGGLLPNADPSMYLSLADTWRRGIRVVTPQTTRQFFPCFLAGMLWICQSNLKAIVSIFALITGGTLFLAWHQVRRSFGWLGATLFGSLVFFFYRCDGVGLLRTEQLGLWFSLIAVALVLQGMRQKREVLWNLGIFSLVMGLNTRAGAYFILPMLALFAGWFYHKGRYGWKSILLTTGVIFAGMLLNVACYFIFFGNPRPTSNFWLCFYGMLTGGNWVTALNEIGLDFLRTNIIARDKSLLLVRANPFLIIKGFYKACLYVWQTNTFYRHPPTSSFFESLMKWATPLGAVIPWICAVIQRRRPEIETFVLTIFVGIMASLPFAPPWDGGERVFAVTNPFLYLAPVLLLSILQQQIRVWVPISIKAADGQGGEERRLLQLSVGLLIVLPFLAIVIPLGLMCRGSDKSVVWDRGFCVPPVGGCPANILPAGFQIHLIPDSERTFVPWVRLSDFRKSLAGNLENLRAPWVLDLLNELPAGTTVATSFHSTFFVIATEKAQTSRWSQRHPILNRKWHRVVFDNDYPIPPRSTLLLSQLAPPPLASPSPKPKATGAK